MRLVTLVATAAVVAAGSAALAAHATAPGSNGQIAFRRFFDTQHRTGAIFLVNPDGSGERQLTHPPRGTIDAEGDAPSFSPDGLKLLFTRKTAVAEEIWQINVDGSHARRLSPA